MKIMTIKDLESCQWKTGEKWQTGRHGKLWSWDSVSLGIEDKDVSIFEQGLN